MTLLCTLHPRYVNPLVIQTASISEQTVKYNHHYGHVNGFFSIRSTEIHASQKDGHVSHTARGVSHAAVDRDSLDSREALSSLYHVRTWMETKSVYNTFVYIAARQL